MTTTLDDPAVRRSYYVDVIRPHEALALLSSELRIAGDVLRDASPLVEAELEDNMASFERMHLSVRPAFVFENRIGDRAAFSGLYQADLLDRCIESLASDAAAYSAFDRENKRPAE